MQAKTRAGLGSVGLTAAAQAVAFVAEPDGGNTSGHTKQQQAAVEQLASLGRSQQVVHLFH